MSQEPFTGKILETQPGEFGKPQRLASLALLLPRGTALLPAITLSLTLSPLLFLSFAFLLSVAFLDLASHFLWALRRPALLPIISLSLSPFLFLIVCPVFRPIAAETWAWVEQLKAIRAPTGWSTCGKGWRGE